MSRLRRELYRILEVPRSGTAGTVVNVFLMTLIVVNVVAVILESVQPIYDSYESWFDSFEIVSVAIFSVEYLGRLWTCVEARPATTHWRQRIRYAVSPMALVDLLAILPFYLAAVVNLDMRFLRALRLLRVFKLSRHSTAMDLMMTVIRNEMAIVFSAMFVMLIVVVVAASGIYLIERDPQPEAFRSIPHAMWWAAVTLTTVGYGDVVPITVAGKIFGLFITIAGVGMVALPAGILASGFSQELQKRRAAFSLEIRNSMADGALSSAEIQELRGMSQDLGIGEEEALLMLRTETTDDQAPMLCPHCGKSIDGIKPAGS